MQNDNFSSENDWERDRCGLSNIALQWYNDNDNSNDKSKPQAVLDHFPMKPHRFLGSVCFPPTALLPVIFMLYNTILSPILWRWRGRDCFYCPRNIILKRLRYFVLLQEFPVIYCPSQKDESKYVGSNGPITGLVSTRSSFALKKKWWWRNEMIILG